MSDVTEIEVTPEMIKAGLSAFRSWEGRCLDINELYPLYDCELGELLPLVFRSMVKRSLYLSMNESRSRPSS